MASTVRLDVEVTGTAGILRGLRGLPKHLSKDLREASKAIATRHMVPSWQAAARSAGHPFGTLIASSIRARSDRVPAVVIGKASPRLSRGLSPTMARYPAHAGGPTDGTFDLPGGPRPLSTFAGSAGWMDRTGSRHYGDDALREWARAVEAVVARWNAGVD